MNRIKKIKGHLLITTLLVWLVSVILSGCVVRLDSNIGEQSISEKTAQVSGMDAGTSKKESDEPGSEKEKANDAAETAETKAAEVKEEPRKATSEVKAAEEVVEAKESDPKGEEATEAKESDLKKTEEKAEGTREEKAKGEKEGSAVSKPAETWKSLDQNGLYTDKDQVALYLHLYGQLPGNYITKKQAEELGWDAGKGNLEEIAPGKSIGGGRFGNREELLPKKEGRIYYECDIDYDGGYRGAKRIVYSSDGLIYYTEDHYKTFELLYTSEGKAE